MIVAQPSSSTRSPQTSDSCPAKRLFIFNSLRTLFLSCASFPHSNHLFSIACALFDKNTRGGVPLQALLTKLTAPFGPASLWQIEFLSFLVFIVLQISFPATHFLSYPYKTPGGVTLTTSSTDLALCLGDSVANPSPKFFRIRSYEKLARNSFRIRSYEKPRRVGYPSRQTFRPSSAQLAQPCPPNPLTHLAQRGRILYIQ